MGDDCELSVRPLGLLLQFLPQADKRLRASKEGNRAGISLVLTGSLRVSFLLYFPLAKENIDFYFVSSVQRPGGWFCRQRSCPSAPVGGCSKSPVDTKVHGRCMGARCLSETGQCLHTA